MNIQVWFPLGLTGWISLQSKGLSRVLQYHNSKASVLQSLSFFMVQLSYPYMTAGKTIALTRWTSVSKVMTLLFNMLSWFVMAFPGGSDGKGPACNAGDGFDPWVGNIPWRRAWQPTPVFLPGKSPWTEEPGGLLFTGSQRTGHDWATNTYAFVFRLVTAFLPRSKLQSLLAVIREPKKTKAVPASTFSPSISHKVIGPDAVILVFWMLSFKPVFSLFSFTLFKFSLVRLHFLPLQRYHLHFWGCWYFCRLSWSSLGFI